MVRAIETAASRLLAELRGAGIDRLHVNAGTDFAPIVDALGSMEPGTYPLPTLATHENLAVGMAHGAYLVTRRPQAAMVHVSVGTANSVCALMNAARDRVPLLLLAGRTPVSEHGPLGARDFPIHWAQEMFDQASMVRELVKWDYEVRDGNQVAPALRRAIAIATTEPQGPVYLSFGREALAATDAVPPTDAQSGASSPAPDPGAIARCADVLMSARFPVIVTAASGADPSTVAALAAFASRHGIGVVEERPRYVNLPHDHEMHLGFRVAPVLGEADTVCVLDCDVPWLPTEATPRDDATVIQVGPDPTFSRYPMRTHRCDIAVTSTPAAFLAALDTELSARQTTSLDRADAIRAFAARRAAATASPPPSGRSISRARLNQALGEVVDDDSIVFSEYWADPACLRRTKPSTFFGLSPAGGLGWAVPAAIGAKLAAPERSVVAAVGDGAYLFANPAAAHHAAAMHHAPVLTIINNNARWAAVDAAAAMMYPEIPSPSPLADLSPIPALEQYVIASDGLGFVVESAETLDEVLLEAKHLVDAESRQVVVNVLTR